MTTVLYIEDHPDNLTLVQRVLQHEGFTFLEARTGLQGISVAESQHVDIILLDINLPDIDGYEVTRRLRNNPKKPLRHIPIIAITANALRGDEQKVRSAGCNGYISKPIDIHTLLDRITQFTQIEIGNRQ